MLGEGHPRGWPSSFWVQEIAPLDMLVAMTAIRATCIGVTAGGAFFGVLCFIFDAGPIEHTLLAVAVGSFTGLLAAPEFCPEAYDYPKVVQVFSGAGAGFCAASFLEAPQPFLFLCTLIGVLIGFFARQFIDAVHVP